LTRFCRRVKFVGDKTHPVDPSVASWALFLSGKHGSTAVSAPNRKTGIQGEVRDLVVPLLPFVPPARLLSHVRRALDGDPLRRWDHATLLPNLRQIRSARYAATSKPLSGCKFVLSCFATQLPCSKVCKVVYFHSFLAARECTPSALLATDFMRHPVPYSPLISCAAHQPASCVNNKQPTSSTASKRGHQGAEKGDGAPQRCDPHQQRLVLIQIVN